MLQVWRKGHLAWECPHTGSSAIAQRQQTPIVNTQQANYPGPTLFPDTNLNLSQTITAEAPITSEIWQILMEQLNKENQDNKPLKKRHIKESSTKSSIGCQNQPTKSGISN